MPATLKKRRKVIARTHKAEKPKPPAPSPAAKKPAAAPVWPVKDVPIDSISIDPKDKRAAHSPESIAGMAQSLGADGQLQIIRVRQVGKGHVVVFGRRRFLAAKQLGWKTIRAEVATLSKLGAQSQSAVENIQRAELTMIEESEEVCRLLETFAEQTPPLTGDNALREIGVRMGKRETWVRDRMYLARLDGEARKLVLEGRLPLQHAREIAKLADPREQADVARWAARDADGIGGRSIDYVRSHVASKMFSLKVIPWELDKKFGGGPACSTCPHNSANAAGLFEHDKRSDVPEVKQKDDGAAGVCLNTRCFDSKKAAAARLIKTATAKAITLQKSKEHKDASFGAAGLVELGVVPAGLKASTVARAVQNESGGAAKPKARVATTNAPRQQSPQEIAESKAREQERTLINEFDQAVARRVVKEPALFAVFALMVCTEEWVGLTNYNRATQAKAAKSPRLLKMIDRLKEPTWAGVLEMAETLDKHRLLDDLLAYDNSAVWTVLQRLGKVLGIELKDRPKAADFMAKGGKP
jgi:ParB/RepB/Spo0J family partition protein